jgi:hypothetical protein
MVDYIGIFLHVAILFATYCMSPELWRDLDFQPTFMGVVKPHIIIARIEHAIDKFAIRGLTKIVSNVSCQKTNQNIIALYFVIVNIYRLWNGPNNLKFYL